MQAATRSTGTAGVIALVVGILIVIGLIAAFVFGSRRREKEPPPPVSPDLTTPSDPAAADGGAPGADSWAAPPSTPGEAPRGDAPRVHEQQPKPFRGGSGPT